MIPICTPDEIRKLDSQAPAPVEALVERSGLAVARAALSLLGGSYGRRITVLAGRGNNGADGRDAARRLERRGARVRVVDLADAPATLPRCDLVIDAALGTGYQVGDRDLRLPTVEDGTPVLAVDLPSGLDATTGEAASGVLEATTTCVLAALKPGLLLGQGPELAGRLRLADIGLDAWTVANAAEVRDDDVARWLPARTRLSHKWDRALLMVAGSAGMLGAATLAARAAQRAGAGLVRIGIPGIEDGDLPVGEALSFALPDASWADRALSDIDRFQAAVVGPGLGRSEATAAAIRRFISLCPCPLLIDADGLTALGHDAAKILAARDAPTVVTPHDGEASRLGGDPDARDRLSEVARLAEALSATVLWKGATTIVAGGELTLVTCTRDSRLATAGSGDVLAGIAGAFLARGLLPERAAAAASRATIGAAALRPGAGLVSGDLSERLPSYLSSIGAAA
ncbi:MAG: NAD(P)H-hydrate dehydratase [Actinobacteria bacterium]|nr:NAD(P)H-hydrate dehydratase [Actinomycetota bacterium]